MNKRMIKKNVKRFILDKVESLPTTQYGAFQVTYEDGHCAVMDNNHCIKNGEVVPEGCIPRLRCTDLLLNIKRTGDTVQKILDSYEHVHLRVGPTVYGNDIRIRLITE